MKKRVVITGVGVIACNGEGKEEFWKALQEGRHGFRKITLFDTSKFNVDIAGEVPNFDPTKYLGTKGLRTLDRSTKLLLSAAKLAIDDSQLKITEENTHDIGVSVGCTLGSLKSINDFILTTLHEGPRNVNPALFPNTVINSPASQVSIWNKIKGFNTTISSGFSSSIDAISYANDFIYMGRAKAAFAGGVEELCEATYFGFHETGFLSGSKKGDKYYCGPFDTRHNGITFGEGAGLIVLEDYAFAKKRKSKILAEILGIGQFFHQHRLDQYDPKGIGLRRAIEQALEVSKCKISDIDYILMSANSNRAADIIETKVIKDVFGKHSCNIPIGSIKSMIGESYSASGVLAVTACIGTIVEGFFPPTLNLEQRDKKCDLNYIVESNSSNKIRTCLVNIMGLNGNSSCIVLRKFEN